MEYFRRRILFGVVLLSAANLSCASSGPVPVPRTLDLIALRNAILARAPAASEFDTDPAWSQTNVEVAGFINKVRGSIHPHVRSYQGDLEHMKFLARVQVDRAYRGIKKNVWTYWVVVDTSSAQTGKWASAYVAADTTDIVLRPLTMAIHNKHGRAKAMWRRNSAGIAWGSCTTQSCCCEDGSCKAHIEQ